MNPVGGISFYKMLMIFHQVALSLDTRVLLNENCNDHRPSATS